MRDSELHLGSFSELKLSGEVFDRVQTEKIIREKKIIDFRKGDNVGIRAFVVQAFEPRFFNVCSQCSKKAIPEGEGFVCGEHGKIVPEKRALVNIVLDDGTESIRAVLFHENLSNLGLTELEDPDKLAVQKQGLLGKEMLFEGSVRNNAFFNTPEFIVEGVKEINLDALVEKLEKD
jgi:hypothetical protein